MAWSNGNLRWQLQFASKSNVACCVDIYMRDYTGSTVTQLTGAATPIYWDEDNDENLLNVVRSKTGYLNVIENTYHELNALHPATDIDHYVEVYYGSTLVFTGFIKAQSFDVPYAPGPRTLKLPITSPLEVMDGLSMAVLSQPVYRTLGLILYTALHTVPANITQIIFPTGITLDTGYVVDLSWKLLSLAYNPYNSDFDNYKQHDQETFTSNSVMYIIEGICNCFGMMVHDYPGMLVFNKVDYSGTYGVYDIVNFLQDNFTPTSTIDSSTLTDYSSIPILSDKGKEMNIMPVKKISINYKGEAEKKAELMQVYDYSKFWTWIQTTVQGKNITYKKFDPAIDSAFWNTGYFPMSDLTPPPYGEDTTRGLWLAEFGMNGLSKKILYRAQQNMSATRPILKWIIWNVPPVDELSRKYLFTMKVERGTGSLHLEKAIGVNIHLRIKMNGKYWNGSDWVTTSSYVTATTDSDGIISYSFTVLYTLIFAPEEMSIEILAGDMASDTYLYALTDVEFGSGNAQEIFDTVIPMPLTNKELIRGNGSKEELSISQAFNVAIANENQVISPTDGRDAVGMPTQYDYMFQSRQRHQLDTMLPITPNIYLQKVKFITDYPRRRIISCGFTPSEDEMNVSMQGFNNI